MGTLSSYSHVTTLGGTERVPVVVTPGVAGGNAYITADEQAAAAPFSSRYVPIAGGVVLTDAAQTFANTTTADITWGTEVSDPDGWISGGSATLTVPTGKGMRYLIHYLGAWSAAPGNGVVALLLNGTALLEAPLTGGLLVGSVSHLTIVRTLVAGDTLKFQGYQNSGSNKDLVSRLEICPV